MTLDSELGQVVCIWTLFFDGPEDTIGHFRETPLEGKSLDVTLSPTEMAGVFFVLKKNACLRMILDAQRSNRRFRPPPSTALLTGEGLGRVGMKGVTTSRAILSSDIKNAFQDMRIDRWLVRQFCLPVVTAKDLGTTGQLRTSTLCRPVFPCVSL